MTTARAVYSSLSSVTKRHSLAEARLFQKPIKRQSNSVCINLNCESKSSGKTAAHFNLPTCLLCGSVISRHWQGRNEVYGIRDQRPKKGWDQGSQPRIRDQSPRDRDQRVFHGLKDQASKFCGIRDQNFHHFWDQGLKICVKIRVLATKKYTSLRPCIGAVKSFISFRQHFLENSQ